MWVELSMGGVEVRVAAGGVLTLHPDAPFRLLKMRSDAWLDLGLKAQLAGMPEVDLGRYHTLSEVMGERIYAQATAELQVFKGDKWLGSVRLAPRLLPIDWLRKAEAAGSLQDRIAFTAHALELAPDDRLLLMRQVDLLGEAQRYQEAVDLLGGHPGLQGDPGLLERIAELFQVLGRQADAAQAMRRLLDLRPQDLSLMDSLARIYERMERWEEATPLLERLTQLSPDPDKAGAWGRLGRAYQQTGHRDEAIMALERAVLLSPHSATDWQALSDARRSAGDASGAMDAQRRAAQLAPADAQLHLNLAQNLVNIGRLREAAQEMEQALALRPHDTALMLRLARLYEEISDRPAQLRVYQRLARLQPGDPDVSQNLGILLLEVGQPEEALIALKLAAQARPNDPELVGLVFEALLRLERWEQAGEKALALLKLRPGDLTLLERLYVGLAPRQPKLVASFLDQALAAGNQDLRLFELRATLALDRDDLAGAAKIMRAAVKAHPDKQALKLQLADVYEATGADDQALAIYEAILDKDPNADGVQERYLQLKTRRLEREPSSAKPAAPAPPSPDAGPTKPPESSPPPASPATAPTQAPAPVKPAAPPEKPAQPKSPPASPAGEPSPPPAQPQPPAKPEPPESAPKP
jgi:tetratricopeptide (TPR) repeat protein